MLPKIREGGLAMEEQRNHAYHVFMLFLSLFALCLMGLELTNWITPKSKAVVDYVDAFVCLLFFLDFVYAFVQAKNKAKYLATWGLLDLASCIPTIDALRWTRMARIVRILRVLRCARSARIFVRFLLERKGQATVLAIGLLVTVVVTASSISVLHFESG